MGTPEAEAARIMTSHGFSTGRRADAQSDHTLPVELLWAQRDDLWLFLPLVGWRWQAWFTLQDGAVATTQSAVTFMAP